MEKEWLRSKITCTLCSRVAEETQMERWLFKYLNKHHYNKIYLVFSIYECRGTISWFLFRFCSFSPQPFNNHWKLLCRSVLVSKGVFSDGPGVTGNHSDVLCINEKFTSWITKFISEERSGGSLQFWCVSFIGCGASVMQPFSRPAALRQTLVSANEPQPRPTYFLVCIFN